MNSVITFLGKSDVLKKDLDYHLIRASMGSPPFLQTSHVSQAVHGYSSSE